MHTPLADRIRPVSLDDIVGQKHLIGENMPLRNIIESGELPNMIFYGPSGTGKTTLARMIAKKTDRTLRKLNCTTAGTQDIRDIVNDLNSFTAPNGILLYLDEIQYFNKKQQQTLLEYIEDGSITLIASTTENPYFYVYSAILSRSSVFEFKYVTPDEVENAVIRGFRLLEKEKDETFEIETGVTRHIANACGGDVRKSLNAVELCVLAAKKPQNGEKRVITLESAQSLTQKSAMKYDREGDEHYDILSAFQKSMRGSDPDAAIHYLSRLLEAGDMTSAIRRLLVCAAEDVGLAYPMILPIVKAATDIALQVGMPEARLPLADAVILVCNSPKSNTAHDAVNEAMSDLQKGKSGPIPRQLQNKHFDGDDAEIKGQFYLYPHDYPNRWVEQQYLPDALKNKRYYFYGDNKQEQAAKEYWDKIKGRK
ncbi:MAG: replication-associated recombination protein A [Ruminococcaceae bacterium]|nr:replication-associated recombination protein A [Oscillospiraceae bacterium]